MVDDDRILREYAQHAATYDRRWPRYIDATVRLTMQHVSLAPDRRVLDVGCGTGSLLAALAARDPSLDLVGVDPVREMLDVAARKLGDRVTLVNAAARALPFPDATFDLVVSSSAFHYVPRPHAALEEMRRVLRPGGHLVITDWCADFLTCRLTGWWLRWTGRGRVRMWRSSAFAALLREAGFVEVRTHRARATWWWGVMTATGRSKVESRK